MRINAMTAISKRRSSTRISRSRRRRPAVELLETRQLLTTFTVTNTNDGGIGSLRRGITFAQNGDVIDFNIPTSDPGYHPGANLWTIAQNSPLPPISAAVEIDGTSQPGYTSGMPVIELNGAMPAVGRPG